MVIFLGILGEVATIVGSIAITINAGLDSILEISKNGYKIDKNILDEVQKKQTSRSSAPRTTSASTTTASTSGTGGKTYKITAYCPCSKCCGKSTGRTASGTKATAGRTVAAPSNFAFGTKLNIGGHVYTVEDRGGAIKGNKIDIFVSSHQEALQWGVRYLTVSVVE